MFELYDPLGLEYGLAYDEVLETWGCVSFDNAGEEAFKRFPTGHVFSNSRNSETSTLGDGDLIDSTPHASKDNKITMTIDVK